MFSFVLPTGIKSKAYTRVPFKFYIKGYADVGYVYNGANSIANSLNNKLMYTGGIGLDVVSIYDIVFRIEYSFNQFRQGGIFVHKPGVSN